MAAQQRQEALEARQKELQLEAERVALLKKQDEAAEQERREQAIAERDARRRADTTPGNPIYKWVDAEGVTHLSTNPPRAK